MSIEYQKNNLNLRYLRAVSQYTLKKRTKAEAPN